MEGALRNLKARMGGPVQRSHWEGVNRTRERFKRLTKDRIRKKKSSGIAQGRVMNEGTGGQYSMFVRGRKKSYLPAHVENFLPPQVLQANSSTQSKSTVGLQAVLAPLALFTPGISTSFTGDKITRVLYEKASGDVTINNIFLSNCYIIIYDVIARKDIGVSSLSTPAATWQQGDTDESASGVSTYLGSTPWQAEAFNEFWKVEQVTNVVLCAGGTHVHKVRLSPRRVVSSAYAQYSNQAFRDLTYYTMIEFHGSPANDTGIQTQVSVGAAGLNIVLDIEHHLKQLQKATPTITTSNNLLGGFTNGEQVVNLGGSTIVAQAEG